ncbi:MAG: uracil-DNA glycosylase [Desulfarculaceae bacterium]|nr:uracil-DNA glycosylase [Desulfarculaceae bacterium]MCF8049013.1 uracil-DNA glycosylase [Desulfarculaceae bacterium]MCF8066179.1 uracil-DNA glycosylase [Desulfarculaceae bacterium]MCF8099852.1 uracil-DNA glycosylase [Desulfarculaceae bacterium]MCF8122795.1 uracil-DNA glycosylase [Desulfarculaceae bacterium]
MTKVAGSRGEMEQLMEAVMPAAPTLRLNSLAQVRQWMGECTRCPLSQGRNKIVFGSGPEDARIMFIGEGPGEQEDRQGLPFVGPAGKLLDAMLAAVGMKREQVYIANIVKCRPPRNRDPQADEVAACRPFLEAQVKLIAPQAICTLGRPAAHALLNSDAPMGRLRGKWSQTLGVPVLPTYHPAYLLRTPEAKALAYADLKALVKGPTS